MARGAERRRRLAAREGGERRGKVATGDAPYSLATDGGPLWVANANSGTVTGIDPVAERSHEDFRTGHRPIAVGARGAEVWVSLGLGDADAQARVSGSNVVHQAGVGNPYFGLDPAVLAGAGWLVLMDVTGARLTENRPSATGRCASSRKSRPASRRPRTAAAPGLRVRPGFRFSPPSGAPVTAESFRSSIERALSPKLVNCYCRDRGPRHRRGERYVAGHTQHISGIMVTATGLDQAGGAVVDAACPGRDAVLLRGPARDAGRPRRYPEPIPSAGPYYIDDNLQDFQLVLRKNPNYAGNRPRRVDGIIVKESLSAEQAGTLVEKGKAD